MAKSKGSAKVGSHSATHCEVQVMHGGHLFYGKWALGPDGERPDAHEAYAAWAEDTNFGRVKSGNWRRV